MKRTLSRIVAMLIIYNYNINQVLDFESIIKMIILDSESEKDFDEDFVRELVLGVINNQQEIDFKISFNLKNYTLDRLSIVDRSILEVGTYELLFTNTPSNIVINEMVEISKLYSEIDDYKTSKFNNAVLDIIAKSNNHGQ